MFTLFILQDGIEWQVILFSRMKPALTKPAGIANFEVSIMMYTNIQVGVYTLPNHTNSIIQLLMND